MCIKFESLDLSRIRIRRKPGSDLHPDPDPTHSWEQRQSSPHLSPSPSGQRTTNRRHLGGESSRPGTREGSRLGGVNDTVEEEEEDSTSQKREQWGSQWEFIFSCVGLSVGIGNLWRFPFLALENGGGAFLLPYLILLIIIGEQKDVYSSTILSSLMQSTSARSPFCLCCVNVTDRE